MCDNIAGAFTYPSPLKYNLSVIWINRQINTHSSAYPFVFIDTERYTPELKHTVTGGGQFKHFLILHLLIVLWILTTSMNTANIFTRNACCQERSVTEQRLMGGVAIGYALLPFSEEKRLTCALTKQDSISIPSYLSLNFIYCVSKSILLNRNLFSALSTILFVPRFLRACVSQCKVRRE